MDFQASAATNAVPSAPYSMELPVRPPILVPSLPVNESNISLMPSFEHVDSTQLTSYDLDIITGNHCQTATDRIHHWAYEQRREAQPILDFLYLGPNSVVRDHHFLQREGITMILVTRDARMPIRSLPSVDKAVETLGIEAKYVDVPGPVHLIKSFPPALKAINDHLLAVYHSQAHGKSGDGQLLVEGKVLRQGKVLVTCESGNNRSSHIVAAYIMSIFGQDMIKTVQFVSMQRFCCVFDDEIKRILQSWDNILKARATVAHGTHPGSGVARIRKRGIADTMDVDEKGAEGEVVDMDRDRFTGRDSVAPFVDK